MMRDALELLEARVLDEQDSIPVEALCALCRLDLDAVIELAELGVLAPRGAAPREWQIPATALAHARLAARLMHDLGVNAPGAALALELLQAQRELERRIAQLEQLLHASR